MAGSSQICVTCCEWLVKTLMKHFPQCHSPVILHRAVSQTHSDVCVCGVCVCVCRGAGIRASVREAEGSSVCGEHEGRRHQRPTETRDTGQLD